MNNGVMSVILLTYKNQNHIFDTIQSILDQDYPEIELIVSDDASGHFDQDSITDFIETSKNKNIQNIMIRQNTENIGTVAHMNLTASLSRGKYIKFISCGDAFYDKSTLTKLCLFMDKQDCPVITSMSAVCSQDFKSVFYYYPSSRRADLLNKYCGKELYYLLSFTNIISALGCIFNESFFRQEGGFDESYHLLEDLPTWLKIARAGGRIPCLSEVTVYYTVGGASSKDGTAFESKSLRSDMILCFEKQIVPYINEFPYVKKHFIRYQYLKLKYYDEYSLITKIVFQIQYFPYSSYIKGKSIVKILIKKIRMN